MFNKSKEKEKPETNPKPMTAKEKGEMLEVVFSKMTKYGVIRYSDEHCTVMVDPTGETQNKIRMADMEETSESLINPFGESK